MQRLAHRPSLSAFLILVRLAGLVLSLQYGRHFRMAECNSFYDGGLAGGSDVFAASLVWSRVCAVVYDLRTAETRSAAVLYCTSCASLTLPTVCRSGAWTSCCPWQMPASWAQTSTTTWKRAMWFRNAVAPNGCSQHALEPSRRPCARQNVLS